MNALPANQGFHKDRNVHLLVLEFLDPKLFAGLRIITNANLVPKWGRQTPVHLAGVWRGTAQAEFGGALRRTLQILSVSMCLYRRQDLLPYPFFDTGYQTVSEVISQDFHAVLAY